MVHFERATGRYLSLTYPSFTIPFGLAPSECTDASVSSIHQFIRSAEFRSLVLLHCYCRRFVLDWLYRRAVWCRYWYGFLLVVLRLHSIWGATFYLHVINGRDDPQSQLTFFSQIPGFSPFYRGIDNLTHSSSCLIWVEKSDKFIGVVSIWREYCVIYRVLCLVLTNHLRSDIID